MEAVSNQWEWGAYERRLLSSFIILCSLVFGLAITVHSLPKPSGGSVGSSEVAYQSTINSGQYNYNELEPLPVMEVPETTPVAAAAPVATTTPAATTDAQPKTTYPKPSNQEYLRNFLQKLL